MILGIDPGFSGAASLLSPKGTLVDVYDLPLTINNNRKQIDAHAFHTLIRHLATSIKLVAIEDVHAMPEQGVSSTFRFGYNAGILFGVLAAHNLKVLKVSPAVWKNSLGLTRSKKLSLEMAAKLFPEQSQQFKRMKDDGRAESALIAYFVLKYFY